jgi:hypothetical protein
MAGAGSRGLRGAAQTQGSSPPHPAPPHAPQARAAASGGPDEAAAPALPSAEGQVARLQQLYRERAAAAGPGGGGSGGGGGGGGARPGGGPGPMTQREHDDIYE